LPSCWLRAAWSGLACEIGTIEGADVSEPVPFKYRAFLSYSHRDKAWANWLHTALESYRIDKELCGRASAAGPVPRTLRPIFRDREDFSAGHSLTQHTLSALEAAQFLIVVCSPNAAQSEYVNEEVRRFKMLGRAARVIPVIVAGEPGDAARECFPPALRFRVAADGAITDEREEPIAADARPRGDGKEIAKQKVAAALLGVGLDEILRRAERARKRRNRFWAALAGVFLLLAIAATGSAVYAWQQLKTNEAFLNATLKRATEIVDEAVAQAETYNVPRAATLRLLARAEGLFEEMARYGRPTPELRYRKAWMLIQFARNYQILGDTGKQFERANQAYDLLAGLAAEKPDDKVYQRDLSIAYAEVGDVLLTQGKLSEALRVYRESLAIIDRLTKADPGNAGFQFDLAIRHELIGDVLLRQGDLAAALAQYEARKTLIESLTRRDPGNAGWQRDLSIADTKVGDVLLTQGKLSQALQAYRESLSIAERLAKADAGNTQRQRDLAVSYERVGNVLMAQGSLTEALQAYRESLVIKERLTKADPGNAGWQRDLSVSYSKVGDVLLAQDELDEALAAHRAALAIAERLSKADPANTIWQRDLSVAYNKIGDVLLVQGKLSEALDSYRESLASFARLTRLDPSNTEWQRDLSVAYYRIAEVLAAQGRLTEALQDYRESLAIAEHLADADRSNTEWQEDLAGSYPPIIALLVKLGDIPQALIELHRGREIVARLVTSVSDNPQWKTDLAWYDSEISRLEGTAVQHDGQPGLARVAQ
jgi:tetratricopeptide (TPR) repeat protein